MNAALNLIAVSEEWGMEAINRLRLAQSGTRVRSVQYGSKVTDKDCQIPIADFRLDPGAKANRQSPISNRQSLTVATAPVLYRRRKQRSESVSPELQARKAWTHIHRSRRL